MSERTIAMQRIQQALEMSRGETASRHHDAAEPVAVVEPVIGEREVVLPARAAPKSPIAGAPQRRRTVRSLSPLVCERNRLKLGHESDATAQAYRMLRTRVLQWLDTYRRNTVAMISGGEGDGKTLSAVNLALSIAHDPNHTVLLVDFDLRSPSIHRRLELDVERGVEAYFDGRAAIDDLLVSVAHPRLAVLPCVAPVAGSSSVLASTVVRDLVAELKARYADRVILFDLPPALAGDDAIAFLPLVESALLVIGEGSTRRTDLERLSDLLRDTPLVGSLLNRAAQPMDPYYG